MSGPFSYAVRQYPPEVAVARVRPGGPGDGSGVVDAQGESQPPTDEVARLAGPCRLVHQLIFTIPPLSSAMAPPSTVTLAWPLSSTMAPCTFTGPEDLISTPALPSRTSLLRAFRVIVAASMVTSFLAPMVMAAPPV